MTEIADGPTFAARLKMHGWLDAMTPQLLADPPMASAVAALHDRVADFADEMFDALPEVPEALADTLGDLLARIEHAHATLTEVL